MSCANAASALKLQDQPFQVLALLLEHVGDVVTREELRQRLWPADTFVDFDTGLSSAVKKLRDVLADSPDEPHYIETIARRYRFIAPLVDPIPPAVPSSAPEPELHPARETASSQLAGSVVTAAESFSFTRSRLLFGAAAVLLLFVAGFLVYRNTGAGGARQPAIKSLAVLPLKNLWFATLFFPAICVIRNVPDKSHVPNIDPTLLGSESHRTDAISERAISCGSHLCVCPGELARLACLLGSRTAGEGTPKDKEET